MLADIPVIGPLLFDQNVIVYLTYVLIVVVDVALFRTRWGLRTRAVGEHPKAADTVGIKVLRTRYRNVIMGGARRRAGRGVPDDRRRSAVHQEHVLAARASSRWPR